MSNQTIDGVPRKALEQALLAMKRIYQAGYDRIIESGGTCDTPEYMMENDPTARELRALLDAPAEQFNPNGWSIDSSAGRPILVHNNCSVIEAEQAYGLMDLIKASTQPQGEPVAIVNSVISRKNRSFEIEVLDNQRLHIGTKLYAEQPAPVAAKVDYGSLDAEQRLAFCRGDPVK